MIETAFYYVRMLVWQLPPCCGGAVIIFGMPAILLTCVIMLEKRNQQLRARKDKRHA